MQILVAYYKHGDWLGYLFQYGKNVWGGFTWHPKHSGRIHVDHRSETLARRFIEDHAGQTGEGVWTEVNIPLPPNRL